MATRRRVFSGILHLRQENRSGHAYHEHSQEEASLSAPPPLSTAGMVQVVCSGSNRSDAISDER